MNALAPLQPSPMLSRPDTSAAVTVEDRGSRAILAACEDGLMAVATMHGDLYPPVRIHGVGDLRPTIQN